MQIDPRAIARSAGSNAYLIRDRGVALQALGFARFAGSKNWSSARFAGLVSEVVVCR